MACKPKSPSSRKAGIEIGAFRVRRAFPRSPSSRKAGIEIPIALILYDSLIVAFLTEGGD